MKKRFLLLFLISGLVLMNACQKEVSLENGGGFSEGSLQDDGAGDCLPKTVGGAYVVNVALVGATNYIDVQVNVTKTGSYTVYTDTVNGMHFRGSGVFTTTGLVTVRLSGSGTPQTIGISNFIVNYGISGCTIAVTTVGSLATFTLGGAPGNCTGAVAGTYTVGTLLNASNNVTLNVNVTVVGAYSISTTLSNGMIFSGSGVFAATRAQAIVLSGSGTPTTAGSTNIPVTAGTSTCSFTITVGAAAGAATFAVNCASAVINGTYTQNTALGASNTVTIGVNVATIGTYTITTTATNGMTFSATGTFAATGAQTVTLTGSGTPTAAGAISIPVPSGTAPCNFTVNVVAAAGAATFTVNCATAVVNGIYTVGTALTVANTVTISINVTVIGTYTITTTATNGMTFSATGSFATTGATSVTLTGTGTPTLAGANTIPVPSGTTPCNFIVNVVAAPVSDYYPRTTNSNWSYEIDDDPLDSLFRKVIAPTSIHFGSTYNIFMQTDDVASGFDSSGYYRKSGNDYYEFLDVGAYIGLDNSLWAEYIFLKDNVPAATSWNTANYIGAVSGTPVTIRFKYTILQKDVSISITTSTGTVSYPNTIVVEERVELQNGPVWIDLTSQIGLSKYYYSRNVGMINSEYYDPANLTTPVFKLELRRYLVL